MTLPRGRIVTLSAYQPRQALPVAIHRGDVIDITVNWVRLLRTGETPNEVLNAASVSGQGVSISNVAFSGKYLSFTVSGARADGEAKISMGISTSNGRTLSRTLVARTVWEDVVIEAVNPSTCQPFVFTGGTIGDVQEPTFFYYGLATPVQRMAYGVGGYESTGGALDITQVYEAEILYFGQEARHGTTDSDALLILVLEGNRAQNYFAQLEIADEVVGFRGVPLLTAEADAYGQDDSGNTYWYWNYTASSGGPFIYGVPIPFSIDCEL